MLESFLIPILAAVVGALVQVLLSGGTRSALERRITFYGQEERSARADTALLASHRIRCQAQLHARDQVRGTLSALGLTLMLASGFYLVLAGRDIAYEGFTSVAVVNALMGLVAALAAAVIVVAHLNSFQLRKAVVRLYLSGEVPGGEPVNPFPEPQGIHRRLRYEFAASGLLLVAAPLGLGLGWGSVSDDWLGAGYVLVSVMGYAILVYVLLMEWKSMHDEAGRISVTTRAQQRFGSLS